MTQETEPSAQAMEERAYAALDPMYRLEALLICLGGRGTLSCGQVLQRARVARRVRPAVVARGAKSLWGEKGP